MNHEDFKKQRLEELANMPNHPKYEPVAGLALAVADAVTVREIPQSEYKTQGGLIIPECASLVNCRYGIVMNKGDMCSIFIKEGLVVAFAPHVNIGVNHKGIDYLKVPTYDIYFIIPPENYLEPHYKDFFEKRRDSRVIGEKNVQKRDNDKLEEKFEQRDETNRKKDYIEGKDRGNKTIIK